MKGEHARGAVVGLPVALLRLHRSGRANVLVTGGTAMRRVRVAREFHRHSPLAGLPFLALDCLREGARLEALLHGWLLAAVPADAEHERLGTLYLDAVGSLPLARQRLLHLLARRIGGAAEVPAHGPARLMAGDRSHLAHAAASRRLSGELLDQLDKVRVELDARRRRGAA